MSLDNLKLFQLEMTSAVQSNQITAYFEIASIMVLVYDYFLTLNLEVGLIWGTPWNIPRFLFFLTRYAVVIDASLLGYFHLGGSGTASVNTCRTIYQFAGWMIFAGTAIAEFVLIFRTWAIWGQNQKVAIGLVVLLFGLGIPAMYLTNLSFTSTEMMESLTPLTQRCFIVKINDRTMLMDYLVILTVESVILVFTLIKGVRHYRNSHSSLVTTLYEDGLIYFVFLNVVSIVNVGVYAFPDQTHGASLILLQRVLHSIFTSRILLRIRLAAVRDGRDGKTLTAPVLTTIIIPSSSQMAQLSTYFRGDEMECCTRETTCSDTDASDLV